MTVRRSAGSTGAGRFDALDLAARGEVLAGEVDISRRPRVADRLAPNATSAPLDAMTLIEDELLLSLPFAPMHPEAQCPAPAQALESGGEPERNTPSPFARLAALKKRSGGTSKE